MSDYTPITEEVRRGYSWNQLTNGYGINAGKEFDRWLFHIKQDAWDEGYKAGLLDYASSTTPNPYRKGDKN